MAREKNILGGGNPHGLYQPISDLEQETLERLAAELAYSVRVVDPPNFFARIERISPASDKRIQFDITLSQNPSIPGITHIRQVTLQLWARNRLLFQRPMRLEVTTVKGPQPVMFGSDPHAGVIEQTIRWDITIEKMNPDLVKEVCPGAVGLTAPERFLNQTAEQEKARRFVMERAEKVRKDIQ